MKLQEIVTHKQEARWLLTHYGQASPNVRAETRWYAPDYPALHAFNDYCTLKHLQRPGLLQLLGPAQGTTQPPNTLVQPSITVLSRAHTN